jgi:alpha 1,2-mannosyltransferase
MRGIITLAGGRKYFVNAYASIRMTRHLGCNLPIKWFYLGDEMKPEWIKIIEEIPNVKCIDLGNVNSNNAKANGGWQNKINAIINCSFDEVLFLDADNFVWRNPEYLFDCEQYKETGAILWKDISDWRKDQNKALEKYFGCIPTTKECCESGQLLFNKNKCMDALLRTAEYNKDSKNAYKIVYGDKDTFYFGFVSTNSPFHFMQKRPSCGYKCLHQYDHNGDIVFSHLTGGKWALNGRPFITKDSYPYVKECGEFIKELKEKLFNK